MIPICNYKYIVRRHAWFRTFALFISRPAGRPRRISLYSCAEAAYRAVGIFWACREVKNARGEIGTPAHLEARSRARADGIEHQSLYCALKCKFSLHRRYGLLRAWVPFQLCNSNYMHYMRAHTPSLPIWLIAERLIFSRVISSNCETWFGTNKNIYFFWSIWKEYSFQRLCSSQRL